MVLEPPSDPRGRFAHSSTVRQGEVKEIDYFRPYVIASPYGTNSPGLGDGSRC